MQYIKDRVFYLYTILSNVISNLPSNFDLISVMETVFKYMICKSLSSILIHPRSHFIICFLENFLESVGFPKETCSKTYSLSRYRRKQE